MMKNYNCFIYDWDGCLAQTLDIWLHTYQTVFRQYNLAPTESEITNAVFGNYDGPLKVGLDKKDLDNFTKQLFSLADNSLIQVELYPHGLQALQRWKKQGKHLAIFTSTKKETILPVVEKYQIQHLVDVIITAEDVTHHKPNPEGIFKAIEGCAANLSDSIMIGDSKNDLGAARNAGIDSVLFYPPNHTVFYSLEMLKQYQPTYIISDHQAIFEL